MIAQELRVGNFIMDGNGEVSPIIGIFPNSSHSSYLIRTKSPDIGYEEWGIEEIKPIALTEEWLVKAGFISNPYMDRYELGSLRIECRKDTGITQLWIERHECLGQFAPKIDYVHQLQNLVFALTGEELKLKE